jgi:hypothetical protein
MLYNGSNPSQILFSDDQMNFALRLEGPFRVVVLGRLSPIHLLAVPPSNAY